MAVPVKLEHDEGQRVSDESEGDNRAEQDNVDDKCERVAVQLLADRFLRRRCPAV